jgi:uncharacterized protein (TIGR02217 family)
MFQTQVTQTNSGYRYANPLWQYALWRVELTFRRDIAEFQDILAFWLGRKGPAYPFLVEDPSDHTDNGWGAVINDAGTYRLAKVYSDTVRPYTRIITRPKEGTIVLDGVAKDGGGECTEADVDLTTGIIADATSTGTATFEFEIPVAFTEDGLQFSYDPAQIAEIGRLVAQEVRV